MITRTYSYLCFRATATLCSGVRAWQPHFPRSLPRISYPTHTSSCVSGVHNAALWSVHSVGAVLAGRRGLKESIPGTSPVRWCAQHRDRKLNAYMEAMLMCECQFLGSAFRERCHVTAISASSVKFVVAIPWFSETRDHRRDNVRINIK